MFKKTTHFKMFFGFLGPGSLGPGPMVPLGPMGPSLGDGDSYLQSGKLPTVRHDPNRSIDMHPTGIDMHTKVSIDLHLTTAYFHK